MSSPSSHKCVVSFCCCGCTLRTGSLIIGWVSTILDALNVINIGIALAVVGWWMYWVTILFYIGHLTISILLLVGISNNNVKFINVFWQVNVGILIYNLIAAITFLAMSASYYDGGALVITGVLLLLSFGLGIYYTVVVRSYALSVAEAPMQPGMQVVYQQGQPGQLGFQPGQPGMQPIMQPVMQPGMQYGMQTGAQPGVQPVMQPGMQYGMQPGMQSGVQPGVNQGFTYGQAPGTYAVDMNKA